MRLFDLEISSFEKPSDIQFLRASIIEKEVDPHIFIFSAQNTIPIDVVGVVLHTIIRVPINTGSGHNKTLILGHPKRGITEE